jgi:hypothetical protein
MSVIYSKPEPLIDVEYEGWVVYLIRATQPVDSHFRSRFTHYIELVTHYIYREFHKIFSFYCFRPCLFLFALK